MMTSLTRSGRLLLALPLLAFAGLGILLTLSVLRADDPALPSVHINQPAPAIDLEALAGFPPFGADDLTAPGIKIVNYWASWCAPCRAEHPNLLALAGTGIPVYGVNYKDEAVRAQAFLDELGNPFAGLGADKTGRVAIDWGVYGIPETFVIDSNGHVLLRHAGPVTSRTVQDDIMPAIASAQGED
ncbi:MAG: DsbE family thiol:disulfide interchange protein [Rhodobacteraceae bacterium]|nr:DsbE family thiol:disulfide interchange protein [Paracoccaceae bacterium]